jgi:hypothetical protein
MSGGSTFHGPSKSEEESEKNFKSSLQEVEEATKPERTRNVFISFHVADEAQVDLLRQQARDEKYELEFRDYSVKEPFDEKWKTNCREQIALTSCTIVMIGEDTASRESVNWEIEESYRQGKKVIGVRINKDKNYPIPKALKDHNAPIVNWKLKDIQKELDAP